VFSDLLVRLLRPVWFRGKARLLSAVTPDRGTRAARVFGARIELDLSDYVQRMMYLGCYEPGETRTLLRYLRPGMTVVDVGANAGYFTYLAAARVGRSGRVLAVEPLPPVYRNLAAAVRDNRLDRVTVVNTALGRVAGSLPLFVPPAAHGNCAPTLVPVPGWEPVLVPVRPLDAVLDECAIDRVDLLKLDVEGFEAEVLAGADRALRSGQVRAVLCEFNDWGLRQNGSSPRDLWDVLAEYGFRRPGGPAAPPDFPSGTVETWFLVRPGA
jgi:FkbM family methyltransferase